jgi:2-polyprenyl-3-methyl-5-hydroxy-6-metoxy-1,4-benzoquinol methylase
MLLITHQTCVCCNSKNISKVFNVNDYTVSNQSFEIWECATCTVRFTQHIPSQQEIGIYYQANSYISHTDTNEGLINKLYHWVRNYTLQTKAGLIKKYTNKKNGSLLDVGAGTGAFSHAMQQHNWQVTGLEPDESARNIALAKYNLPLHSIEDIYTIENQFNAITLWHVLEHVHDLHGYFKAFYKLLANNGKLFIAVPNYTSADATFYKQHWAAYDVPRHLYHFSPVAMKHLAKQHGFSIVAYKPMWFDSVYVSMLSEQYKTNKQQFLKALWHGFKSNFYALFDNKKCSSVIYVLEKK